MNAPTRRPLVRATILLAVACVLPTPVAPAAPAPAGAQDYRARIAELRRAAMGDDLAASRAALTELFEIGDAGRAAQQDVARQLLARDKTTVERAAKALGDAKTLKQSEEQLAALR